MSSSDLGGGAQRRGDAFFGRGEANVSRLRLRGAEARLLSLLMQVEQMKKVHEETDERELSGASHVSLPPSLLPSPR